MILKTIRSYFLFLLLGAASVACNKTNNSTNEADSPGTPSSQATLNYGDSVFYVNEQIKDYSVAPLAVRNGEYWSFPEGIKMDEVTGVIDVNKSETGLRYKIFCKPSGSNDTINTTIVLSGINYLDKIYNLSNNETIAYPIYNGDFSKPIPGNGNSVFDEGGGCNSVGIAVNKSDGRIDLAQTVRNGAFGATPTNGANQEVDLDYRIQDKSNKSLNSIKVKLYFFNTAADITADLVQLIQDRAGTIFNTQRKLNDIFPVLSSISAKTVKVAKPRPPCIFIVSH